MDLSINNLASYNYKKPNNRFLNSYKYNFLSYTKRNSKQNYEPLGIDFVTFCGRRSSVSAEERMTNYANKLLKDNNLQKGQPIYIKGDSYYLPFMQIFTKEAYKNHSGYVVMDVTEAAFETLKKKYNKTKDFEYKKTQIEELKKDNAIFFEFNKDNDPYKKAKVYRTEAIEEYAKNYTKVPPRVSKLFKISPKEILVDCLDIRKKQPVQIFAEREHIPLIKKLMNYLYAKNNTDLVDVNLNNADLKNLLLYADEEVIEKSPEYKYKKTIELAEKKAGSLYLYGPDSNELENVDIQRIGKEIEAWANYDIDEAEIELSNNLPWVMYYAPTTMSSVYAYKELADDKLKMLSKAYMDANKINRIGRLKEHIQNLEYRIEKLNDLLDKGYRTFKYTSIDEKTNKPDGKTDFIIKISQKSKFHGGPMPMPKYGYKPLVNVPTEEVFTTPLNNSAQGKIKTTIPLSVDGKLITDLNLEFKNGKVTLVDAGSNKDILIKKIDHDFILKRLGELAIVADSPIAKTNRVFNNVLLDENASAHLALGHSFDCALKDTPEFDNFRELCEYLDKENINPVSGSHVDFMVGDKNVVITAINEETGDCVDVVRDDKFLL